MKISRKSVRDTLDKPTARHFTLVNDVLAAATIISILSIVLETVPALSAYHPTFLFIEWAAVVLFSVEYVLRLWSTEKPLGYALSPFGIIDLAAILPTFLGLGNFSFFKSARVVRIIRFLRLARMTKLSRTNIENAEETLGIYGFNIALYAVTLLLIMLILGVGMHVFISGEDIYWSVPGGMYWAFAIFLGGLPAPILPGTSGTIIYIVTKFCGMALFGLLIGVISKMFNQWILGRQGK